MPKLSDEMKELVERQRLGFVATVCPDGTPNLSPKGTVCVLDDEHLIFADIRSPGTVSNLRAQSSLSREASAREIYYRLSPAGDATIPLGINSTLQGLLIDLSDFVLSLRAGVARFLKECERSPRFVLLVDARTTKFFEYGRIELPGESETM